MTSPTVFVSYSHKDEKWKNRLVEHMGILSKQGLLELWDDRRINAGQDWYQEIQKTMDAASLGILLISANSLTSDFILREEVQRLLERKDKEGLPILPIIISPCDWQAVPWLRRMQLRPRDGRPLSSGRKHQIDADLANVAKEVRELLNSSIQPPHPQELALGPSDKPSTSASLMVSTQKASIEVTIDKDFNAYSEREQAELLHAIAKFLAIAGDVRVTSRRPGSVKLVLELETEQAERLYWAMKAGEFAEFGVADARLIDPSAAIPGGTQADAVVTEDVKVGKRVVQGTERVSGQVRKEEARGKRVPSPTFESPVRIIGSRELHQNLPGILRELERKEVRYVLVVHGKPRAVLIGAEPYLDDILAGKHPKEALVGLQLSALMGSDADALSLEDLEKLLDRQASGQ